jgi:hypothetical protein
MTSRPFLFSAKSLTWLLIEYPTAIPTPDALTAITETIDNNDKNLKKLVLSLRLLRYTLKVKKITVTDRTKK